MSIQPTVRRTMVIVSTVVLAVLLLASSVMATSAAEFGRGEAVKVSEHTVGTGDTLWSIAGRAVEPGEDRRAVVQEIRRLNDLTSTVIHPGQVLLIPSDGPPS